MSQIGLHRIPMMDEVIENLHRRGLNSRKGDSKSKQTSNVHDVASGVERCH